MPPSADISAEIVLTIINPYETFTPRHVEAELVSISAERVRLTSSEVGKEECETLLEFKHVSKITLRASFLVQPLILKGDIFWARYIPGKPTEPGHAELGFMIRKPEEINHMALKLVANKLNAKPA